MSGSRRRQRPASEKCVARPVSVKGVRSFSGAPEGLDALLLAKLAKEAGDGGHIHIARDGHRAELLQSLIAFFAPRLEAVLLPGWDSLPYDRMSPSGERAGRRVAALERLAIRTSDAPLLLIATPSGLVQRVPPTGFFADAREALSVGSDCDAQELKIRLIWRGYNETALVQELGEFVLRGAVLDFWPPAERHPIRIEFVECRIAGLRPFDPATQQAVGELNEICFGRASEVPLEPDAVERFRAGQKQRLGGALPSAIAQALEVPSKPFGIEPLLPLFHARLTPISDWLPDATLSIEEGAGERLEDRLELIAESFEAHRSLAPVEEALRPLPPEALYLRPEDWKALQTRGAIRIDPAPPAGGKASDLGGRPSPRFIGDRDPFAAAAEHLAEQATERRRILFLAPSRSLLNRLLPELAELMELEPLGVDTWPARGPAGKLAGAVAPLETGFVSPKLTVVTAADILGVGQARPSRSPSAAVPLPDLLELAPGDHVVHIDHGIGRIGAPESLDASGVVHGCAPIEYAGEEKLWVPAEDLDLLSRYGGEAKARLDHLGANGWAERKRKTIEDLAAVAARLAAMVEERRRHKADSVKAPAAAYRRFVARFPYLETEDQARAIAESLEDLASGRRMDRLICGDVGFGKTEVALRACFAVAASGRQAAVLAPTTPLSAQHLATFRRRFAGFGVEIAELSRRVSPEEAKLVKSGLADGSIGIAIGTQALLSRDIRFKDLALIVIDEEQRLGVQQKEALSALSSRAHRLMLTATPIPRTLEYALLGLREISVIATPPADRLPVRSSVLPHEPAAIADALRRERARGGQSFYVCPAIADLEPAAEELARSAPELTVAIAHGKTPPAEADRIFTEFLEGRIDVLLSTDIVESGLDIPNANTIVVRHADRFGLAQLHQLRGRVGRSTARGYAFLTYAEEGEIGEAARLRLASFAAGQTLGAGFAIAARDYDLRGAGDVIGEDQSGQVRAIGSDLYLRLLKCTVEALRRGEPPDPLAHFWTPQIDLGLPLGIPEELVPDAALRLSFYRRLAMTGEDESLDGFAARFADRFGDVPEPTENLICVAALKRLCRRHKVQSLQAGPRGAALRFAGAEVPAGAVRFVQEADGRAHLRGDGTLVWTAEWDKPERRMRELQRLMRSLGRSLEA
jgi:transcription-repair coupling factor (superfamily II helicase)